MKKQIEKDLPVARPRTLGEARRLIESTFVFNGWNERDKRVFCAFLSLEYSDHLDSESARMILENMEKSRMILFTEN